jgi:hypothetical protein
MDGAIVPERAKKTARAAAGRRRECRDRKVNGYVTGKCGKDAGGKKRDGVDWVCADQGGESAQEGGQRLY